MCSVCAETKNYYVYLGYYSFFNCDCGYTKKESEYVGDYRFCEHNNSGVLLSCTEKSPFTLDYPDKLKAYLYNPKSNKSDVKNIIDALGVPEKIERFNIIHETFITDGFGEETALEPMCEIINVK